MATEVDLNRWREAGKEIGRKIGVVEERERIMKLLEEIAWNDYGIDGRGYYESESQAVWLDQAIALIKGENK